MRTQAFRHRYGPCALVVGGSEGLGFALARELAARGLDLALVARRAGVLEAAAESLRRASGVQVRTFALDLAERVEQAELLRRIEGLEIGLLACSAAVSPIGPFLEIPFETHERLLDLNCRAAALLAHGLGRRMAERRRGGIVLVSSMAGFQGTAQVAHYAASKAYLRVLAEGLWEELRPHGVDVLGLCAGQVDTPTFRKSEPAPPAWMPVPVMQAEEVAREALEALGRVPVTIPGVSNRIANFLTQRLLPRRSLVQFYSASTRAMYPPRRER